MGRVLSREAQGINVSIIQCSSKMSVFVLVEGISPISNQGSYNVHTSNHIRKH